MELYFQVLKSDKATPLVKSFKTAESIGAIKPIETKRPNKRLLKKLTKGKVKKIFRSYQTNSGRALFEKIITVEELAVIFGLAPQTIRNWVAQGKLPYVKVGKRNLFLRESLQKWLDQKEEPQWP